MAASHAKQPSVVAYDCAAKLGDVVLEIDQILTLLVCYHVVKVDVLVAPFKIVDNPLISKLFLNYEEILEAADAVIISRADLSMEIPSEKLGGARGGYNISGCSFTAGELVASIQRHLPDFTCAYEPDVRQKYADSWPNDIDDEVARSELS